MPDMLWLLFFFMISESGILRIAAISAPRLSNLTSEILLFSSISPGVMVQDGSAILYSSKPACDTE